MSKQFAFNVLLVLLAAVMFIDRLERGRAAAEEGAEPAAAGGEKKGSDTALDYAKLYLKFVQLDIKRADEVNRRISGTVPPAVMDELRDSLAAADARVKALARIIHECGEWGLVWGQAAWSVCWEGSRGAVPPYPQRF